MISNLNILIIKALRKLYVICFNKKIINSTEFESNEEIVSQVIFDSLVNKSPCMIARLGANELSCLVNYKGIINNDKKWIGYIKGNSLPWWWNENGIQMLKSGAGFFPSDYRNVEKFCQLMFNDMFLVDILGSWLPDEKKFEEELKNVNKVHLELLNPYFSDIPWTRALENKKILVVHPFAETIEKQYKKRHLLFENNLLPEFELKTIKAVQSIAGTKTSFNSWFEALDFMKNEIDKVDYDICLIGCGAYGFPLAAHVKRSGKKGFHLGGSLQLLFGIKGKRWENPNYNEKYNYSKLINEYWVYPDNTDKPANAHSVEGACYW